MAGSLTVTGPSPGPVRTYTLAWVADGSGNVSGTDTEAINGCLVGVVFIPGTSTTEPDDNYDVVLNDSDGIDVLGGVGANLDEATATRHMPAVSMTDGTTTTVGTVFVDGKLSLVVSGAGDSNVGTVKLFVR